jgi:RNA polymerase sigma factor for flagellar operon FliA
VPGRRPPRHGGPGTKRRNGLDGRARPGGGFSGEPSSVERLWEECKLKASADARERLILHHAPLVKYVVGRVLVGPPPNIE